VKRGIPLDLEKYEIVSDLSAVGAYEAASVQIRKNPDMTAIYASTDLAAIGAIQACLDAGKRVPEDISVIGYDDIELARLQIGYPLTTIAQPKDLIGKIAFEMLKDLMQGNKTESVLLKPELVVRKTTAPR
jgi:DNA-binding LacI/PurR family transcriptional regulator